VLVVLDACRADHLSSMGYARQTTPNLDRLAAHGLLFAHHYSGSNGTIMGVSQLMTSALRPPLQLSSPGAPELPSDNARGSLPSVFAEGGYHTALFVGHPYFHPRLAPITRVFDQYTSAASPDPSGPKANLDDILARFEPWLATQRAPFFAYLHAMDTHFPHPLRSEAPLFVDRHFQPSFANGAPPVEAALLKSPRERDYVVGLYDEDLHQADRAIGALMDTLGRLGRLDDTIVVVTADHGEQLYEAGFAGHGVGIGNLPEAEIHIPLIVSYGRHIGPQRIDGITRSIDVAPSMLALAGLPTPPWMTGNVLIRRDGAQIVFDQHSASPFAPVFNQDRDPVRVALRFPRMKYFTRWAANPSAALPADDVLVTLDEGNAVITAGDPRFSEARDAWRRLVDLLRKPPLVSDDTLKRLRQRLRTLGYVSG
jgi:arylsulfatase A-like enzyme